MPEDMVRFQVFIDFIFRVCDGNKLNTEACPCLISNIECQSAFMNGISILND